MGLNIYFAFLFLYFAQFFLQYSDHATHVAVEESFFQVTVLYTFPDSEKEPVLNGALPSNSGDKAEQSLK
jgi:hypothetical protein